MTQSVVFTNGLAVPFDFHQQSYSGGPQSSAPTWFVDAKGNARFTGITVDAQTITGNLTVQGNLTVTGTSTLTGAVTASSTIAANGVVTFAASPTWGTDNTYNFGANNKRAAVIYAVGFSAGAATAQFGHDNAYWSVLFTSTTGEWQPNQDSLYPIGDASHRTSNVFSVGYTASGDPGGTTSHITYTGTTAGNGAANTYLVQGGQAATTPNTGWLKLYNGSNAMWVPVWTNATP